MSKPCKCRFCLEHREWDAVVERGDVDELCKLVHELRNDLCCAEFDLDRYKAIKDGSWHSAREFALGVIERVDAREAKAKEGAAQ